MQYIYCFEIITFQNKIYREQVDKSELVKYRNLEFGFKDLKMRSPSKKQKRKRIQTLDSDEEEEDNLSYQQNRAKRHSQDDEEDDFERPQQNANQNEGAGDINLKDWKLEPGVIEYVKVYVVLFQIFIR